MEYKAAVDSGVAVLAKHDGVVKSVSADEVVIETTEGKTENYELIKFLRSNARYLHQPAPHCQCGRDRDQAVRLSLMVLPPPMVKSALGKNMLIGFITWEGYNYEDAVLINEKSGQGRYLHLDPHRGI